MILTNKGKVYVGIILLSALFSYLIVSLGYFPHAGLALSITLISTVLYFKYRSSISKYYYCILLLFSFFIFLRSEILVTFLNLSVIIYAASLFLISLKRPVNLNLMQLLFSPLLVIIPVLFSPNRYSLEFVKTNQKRKNLSELVVSILITIFLLGITIPILAAANPIFANIVKNFFDISFFLKLLRFFDNISLVTLILRLLIFAGFLILLPRLASYLDIEKQDDFQTEVKKRVINLIVPKISLIILLLIFFITQLQLYFSSESTLISLGYTHSQYAREVFAQLSVVAVIILVLLYNDIFRDRKNRISGSILLLQVIFLILMAGKSDYDYSSQFGFTMKRLYGFSGLLVITGILVNFYQYYLKEKPRQYFITRSVAVIFIVAALINLMNFDYLIYHFHKSNLGYKTDYRYLSRLSADSLSYQEQLEVIQKKQEEEKGNPELMSDLSNAQIYLTNEIRLLQYKYHHASFQQLTIYDYLQYRQIKDINVNELNMKNTQPTAFP